ncbi:amino acid ABC transporter ATP-binding protein [Acetobacter conturbans]|uniref:ATP-binding cassette domain-containing protein n=1 Tax=Acetobacter conturbans TaxID=1737472 RepID=A0ABX0K3S6_9PROT|nr:amino acid ABC transporter ATP-binding protein [Acetobacter conturbans]NHN89779.1 ATP-binding cassette domain-containing protein [Acetobacter conturbans]
MLAKPVLSLEDIRLTIDGKHILNGCDLKIPEGEVVVILGPSGSGKSTLMRCINLLQKPDSGRILFDGEDILNSSAAAPAVRRKIGMVFQGYDLFEHMTVWDNLLLAPRLTGGAYAHGMSERAAELLDGIGLLEHAGRYPHQLSGGQQQRVAIVRALVMQPRVMLFDEPTSALDPEATEQLQKLFGSAALKSMAKVVVTHDIGFARRVADRIVFIENGSVIANLSAQHFFSGDVPDRLHRFLTKTMPELKLQYSEELPSRV